ncbi:P-loop containing nucleoside triphosphate hydrolase protein [Cokeromyces recurvatus]|uniref:P-loop containing nucleoside triphosphate hydrolase protein n=1 Tax=Cokeromyces recurvatus TaxID=90255 RepID=UPI002220E0C0|nr:P-loop containing nucleoside triphosphate hydrolase protein [Cokeromyces recurvatus]KAI7906976.1 P-loop containing nucleoside triphosphate hydrolase protein [Cokeromyces recurvatus]
MAAYNHTDHLILHVPNPGACYFQDHIVHKLAAKNKTNLLVLDSQDFIFLAQHCFHHDAATLLPMLSAIDPDSNVLLALKQANFNLKSNENEDNKGLIGRGKVGDAVEVYKKDEENEEDLIDDEDVENANKLKIKVNSKPVEIDLNEIMNHQHHHHHPISLEEGKDIHQISKSLLTRVSTKYMEMFRQFLSEPDGLTAGDAGKIIYLRDYGNMQDAFTRIMLKSLVMAVEGLKQKGHRLMIVASYYEEREGESSMTTAISNMRPISILPSLETEDQINQWKSLMKQDEAKRIAEINMKQLLAMTSQKSSLEIKPKEPTSLLKELLNLLDYESISKAIWSPIEVDRRVMIAIGHALNRNKKVVDVNDFKIAHDIVQHTFKLREKNTKDVIEAITPTTVRLTKDGSLDIDYLKKNCNDYERKMISRIVDPSKVQGSFKDVRAPITTIDTLQSLVSLPLKRPDLFNKGILKRNFIPGVLLFGPPGTGKTMLAKAVAKDSGSRMLDIQASDVYDMYVGQGEKNVKAIFSLARKLSPCVIFIDEVDSLMNKRGGDFASNSHREIINQLMVEWDGLSSNNQGVIVMAATNRPYDLDDAVLRRMPRRILVDLPNEEDRIEILKILLRDEDHQVSVKELAKMTEHYSGSDLKNVCVSAALKAVQQEAQSKIPQVLTMEHFREALKMVPPSSNEDMDSLVEIRKWDSKFGDGKKKKKTSIGFSSS